MNKVIKCNRFILRLIILNIFFLLLIIFSCTSKYRSTNKLNNKEEAKVDTIIYIYVEKMPEFPGGQDELMNFIRKTLIYPEVTLENGICGRIYFSFIIDVDGSVIRPEIVRSCGPSMDEEILKFIRKMPKWIPGEHNGVKVKVKMSMPINIHPE